MTTIQRFALLAAGAALLATGCLSAESQGLAPAEPAATTVRMDFFHRPLPEIPLPNDIATRYDGTSATGRRINASMVAPTSFERVARQHIDKLDGWGVYQPITIPFTGPLDVLSVRDRHCRYEPRMPSPAGFEEPDEGAEVCAYDPNQSDDALYLINITPDSPEFGRLHHLDVGHGNFPVILEDMDGYWGNDPRAWTNSILFDEENEDTNQDGLLQPTEDTDSDGVLDRGNYLPGLTPARDDLKGRADALMTFYEKETSTLIVRPLMPLRERTTYAVVITRRVRDAQGDPVGSPYPWICHTAQTEALRALPDVLPEGLALSDIAFAFTFTTQTIESGWKAVRDGLYGHGIQAHLGEDFPPRVAELLPLRDAEYEDFSVEMTRPTVLPNEHWAQSAYAGLAPLLGSGPGDPGFDIIMSYQPYIDFHVVGAFDAPQLFPREDSDGNPLGLGLQVWPEDLDRVPAKARSERVYFWLTVPRKEISDRGDGKPAPVVILGHGYTSQRFEALEFAPFFAQHGVATLAIDNVSHGIGLSQEEFEFADDILSFLGLGPFMEATLTDRAFDQNGDGIKDSGADFWTGYMFHTRDVVRQTALDYMALIRLVRSFDGKRRWAHDVDGDGEPELAGDFDADGEVDIGLGSTLHMTGGSLGGIMTAVVAGIEPEITTAAPLVGGGSLGDIGFRSLQGGVREAVVLRVMGPVFTGTIQGETDILDLKMVIPDLNDTERLDIGSIEGVSVGDTVRFENVRTGEAGCGIVDGDGRVRGSVGCDVGDPIRIFAYNGHALEGGIDCQAKAGAEPYGVLDTFGLEVKFQQQILAEGEPLVALAEGIGKRRSSPGVRRFMSLAQVVLDPCDPGVLTEFIQRRPIHYPGTGQRTGAHLLAVTTMGDMNVPASGGVNLARSAGLIDFLSDDPRYQKSANQVLIETGTAEAVHIIGRYHDVDGNPVHIDVENFADGKDPWWDRVPRLDPPIRLVGPDVFCQGDDKLPCGQSGIIFPYPRPTGQHGFSFPAGFPVEGLKLCKEWCTESPDEVADPCGCGAREFFDIGHFMFNTLGRYMASGGTKWDDGPCNGRDDCEDLPAFLEWRDVPGTDAYDPDALK